MGMEISSENTQQQLHIFNKPKLVFTKIKLWILRADFFFSSNHTKMYSNISQKIPKYKNHKSEWLIRKKYF